MSADIPLIQRATTRLWAPVLAGLVIVFAVGAPGYWNYGLSVGWDAAGLTYSGWTWLALHNMDEQQTAAHAVQEGPTKRVSMFLLLLACFASLAGLGYLLISGHDRSATQRALVAALGVGTVTVSWVVIHTLYVLRYATLYYTLDGSGLPQRGIDFNQPGHDPTYSDFAYVGFTLGMTYQVSDTAISERSIRKTVLRQSLLSYVFGAVIIASVVNLVVSLASGASG